MASIDVANPRVDFGALSHEGLVRRNNEDRYLVIRLGRYLEPLLTNLAGDDRPGQYEKTGYGIVVADGMGGRAAGEVASSMAITTLLNLVLATPDWVMTDDESGQETVIERTTRRLEEVNAAIHEHAQRYPNLIGMGTTITLAVIIGKIGIVMHIGDSRAYVLRGSTLYRLTRDHTVAQYLADSGLIPNEEIATHKKRHVLTKAVGAGKEVTADIMRVRLEDGDRLLLCTDGLTDMVEDARIGALLADSASPEVACRSLVDAALTNGGRDNVTAVVAHYQFERLD